MFSHIWDAYGEKYDLCDADKCIDHAIRESFILVQSKTPAVFDWKRYIRNNPYIQRQFQINGDVTCADATIHYLNHGIKERRRKFILGTNKPYVYDFDWKKYDELNPDVFTERKRGEKIGEWHCFRHWCEFGYKENRKTDKETHLSVKIDASISTDENINKQWREKLSNLINKQKCAICDNRIGGAKCILHKLFRRAPAEFSKPPSVMDIFNSYTNIQNVAVCSNSNLSYTGGDTTILYNLINQLMDHNIYITLLSTYYIQSSFIDNFRSNSYTLIKCNDNNNLIFKMNELQHTNDGFLISNHEILDDLRTCSFLHKTCFYGLDIDIDGIALMKNKFHSIITPSKELYTKYIETGIIADKIDIIEPLTYKYDFKTPKRTDDEIRLIFCGILCDEENIIEIIEEFKKLHKKLPNVVFNIVYRQITGDTKFTETMNEYIKKGVDGVTFKHILSHRDRCYEIETSDIGICLRKNNLEYATDRNAILQTQNTYTNKENASVLDNNGETNTKVNEYLIYNKMYLPFIPKYNELTYKFLLEFKNCESTFFSFFKEIIAIYKNNVQIIPYILHNGMPYDNGGYAVRGHNIMNTFNNVYTDKMYIGVHRLGYPYSIHVINKYVNKIDNVYYITLPVLIKKNYNRILRFLTELFQIKTFHVASSYSNAEPIINFCNMYNLKSIYEVRGMWQLTGISRTLYYTKHKVDKNVLDKNYNIDRYNSDLTRELECIKNCTTTLYITDELYLYANSNLMRSVVDCEGEPLNSDDPSRRGSILTSLNEFNIYNLLNTNSNDLNRSALKVNQPIFYNCNNFNIDNDLNTKNERIRLESSPFIIGYSGSIVYYEGISESIFAIEKLIQKYGLNIEFHILGNIQPILLEQTNMKVSVFTDAINKPFVKHINKVPHEKVREIISNFDLYIIPRLDLPVTNIVSPLKPFEPMALKIPLLMSDCLCLNKIAENGKNCMLFERDNFDDFNDKVLHIIGNGYDEQLLEKGYNFVKQERNWTNMIKHVGLYDILE